MGANYWVSLQNPGHRDPPPRINGVQLACSFFREAVAGDLAGDLVGPSLELERGLGGWPLSIVNLEAISIRERPPSE